RNGAAGLTGGKTQFAGGGLGVGGGRGGVGGRGTRQRRGDVIGPGEGVEEGARGRGGGGVGQGTRRGSCEAAVVGQVGPSTAAAWPSMTTALVGLLKLT